MGITERLLIPCGVVALLSLPLLTGLVPPNRYYGFRTIRTLNDHALWQRANRFAGIAFLTAALVSASLLITVPILLPLAAFVVPFLVAAGACFVYLSRAA